MKEKQLYASYNGLSRTATYWGVPYVEGMGIFTVSVMVSLITAFASGGIVWLYPLAVGGAILMFLKTLCENDDAGLDMFITELKWRFIKSLSNDSGRYGGKLTIHSIRYRNEVSNVEAKHYFKKHVK